MEYRWIFKYGEVVIRHYEKPDERRVEWRVMELVHEAAPAVVADDAYSMVAQPVPAPGHDTAVGEAAYALCKSVGQSHVRWVMNEPPHVWRLMVWRIVVSVILFSIFGRAVVLMMI